ncbi:tail fiber domain-containing protein [Nubsella zeaxanthinifaciens]|uniref:tail fiber domain-containing protein n=1 Tax=Nubsella zeaxanthinifaciens TaxID=392412 RepID=UPI000DE53F83|nr:tail fiber domain-containing protein [Nubsella zeaxanthinifaciens]
MSIPPITDDYIDEVIKSAGPYVEGRNKTQGVKLRELIKLLRDYFKQEIPKKTSELTNDANFVNADLLAGLPVQNGQKKPFVIKPLVDWDADEVYGVGNQPINTMLVATQETNGVQEVVQIKISDGITAFKDLKNLIGEGVIKGGTEGQTLEKQSGVDGDATWVDIPQKIADALALKLNAADYNEYFKGKYTSLEALQTALPIASIGDYAQVDEGAGVLVKTYNWDENDGWVIGGYGSGATTTDELPEGLTNLYFNTARLQSYGDVRYALKSEIPSNYVTTDSAQSAITGQKTWAGLHIFNAGMQLQNNNQLNFSTAGNTYNGYLRGDGMQFSGSSGNYITQFGSSYINFKFGGAGYTSLQGQAVGVNNTVSLPSTSGVLALVSQIPTNVVSNDNGVYSININGSALLWNNTPFTAGNIASTPYFITLNDTATNAGYSSLGQVSESLGINNGSTLNNSINGSAEKWNGQSYTDATNANIGTPLILAFDYNNSDWRPTYLSALGLDNGSTLNNNISGSADKWNGKELSTAGLGSILGLLLGLDSANGKIAYFSSEQLKSYVNINDGSALNNNISGTAASASVADRWGGELAGFSVQGDVSGLAWIAGYDNTVGFVRPFNSARIQTWLGLNNGSALNNNISGTADNANFLGGIAATYYHRSIGFAGGHPGSNADTVAENTSSFSYANNAPYNGALAHFGNGGYGIQLNGEYGGNRLAFRNRNGDTATWNAWKEIVNDGFARTWDLNINGSAANANYWGSRQADLYSTVTSVGAILATGSDQVVRHANPEDVRRYLGLPTSGGYDLQSVTDRGNTTTNGASFGNNVSVDGSITSKNLKAYTPGLTAYRTYNSDANVEISSYQSVAGGPFTKTTDIVANADGTVGSEMRFLTKKSGSSNNATTNLIIKEDGNIGVGTISPIDYSVYGYGANLEVRGGRGGGIISTDATAAHRMVFSVDGSAGIGSLKTVTSTPLVFAVNDDEKVRILVNGNVGIGTLTPSAKLHVAGAIESSFFRGYAGLQTDSPTLNQASAHLRGVDVGVAFGQLSSGGNYGSWMQSIRTDGTPFNLIINPNGGSVAIGRTTANYTLDVQGDGRFSGTHYSSGIFIANGGLSFYNAAAETKYIYAVDDVESVAGLGVLKNGSTVDVFVPNGSINVGDQVITNGRLLAIKSGGNGNDWTNAHVEIQGTNPGVGFHFPGTYGASLYMNGGGTLIWTGNGITTGNGGISTTGALQGGRITAGYDSGVAGSVNITDYLRTSGSGGIWWATHGIALEGIDSSTFRMGTNTNTLYLQLTTNGSVSSGYLHVNSVGDIGFLTNDASWKLRVDSIGYVYADSFNSPNWFRSSGSTGWFSSTHGGGIYMIDSTWVRTYNDKGLFVSGTTGIIADSSIQAAQDLAINSTAADGRGLSLYGGPGSAYKIAFAQTAAWGTHGSVNGDYATYLTMSGDSGRGWVFKANSNVASISNNGNATFNGYLTAIGGAGTSDKRFKDIKSFDFNLRALDSLLIHQFTWNHIDEGDRQHWGYIAQEVEKITPHLIMGTEDHKTLNKEELLMLEVARLKQRVSELEALTRQ